jgi:UDP:flavonoid glycosyltransferase YjiC (YdhE family)
MRVLFATTAGAGHFGPMTPLAQACVAAGHEVAVAAPESFADDVARVGLTHAGFADVAPEIMGQVFGRLPGLPREEANRVVLTEVFGRLDARAALPGVTAFVREWSPDLVVREPAELASLVVAEAAGIPHAQVSIGMTVTEEHMAAMIAEPLAELAALAGLEPEQAATALVSMPRFTCVPAALDEVRTDGLPFERAAARGPLHRFRAASPPPTGDLPSAWGNQDQPLVYVSFGSVTATIGPFGAIYPSALGALADLPFRVLMTTGAGLDPADLAPVPPNAHVEAWWPQQDVLPHAAAVVGHGGFGTTIATLAAGVPQIVVPLFAHDQFINAARVEAIGAGIHLDGGPAAAAGLAEALAGLLATDAYRDRAAEVADDMAGQLPVAACVPLLEALARA